ncbi:MAG: hypothetical protein HQ572_03990 [Candidatus Omnitrophica bacterium]|nr:hypothetical protein [Candidatus Omnitrophota bacterium]
MRLNTVFPVELQVIDQQKNPITPLLQGFTRNVGKGGMCIEVKSEKTKEPFNFISGETKVKLLINIPSGSLATESYSIIRWSRKISEYALDTYILGVEYDQIEPANQNMIERHILWLHRRPKVIFAFFIVSLIFTILLTYLGIRPQ